MITIRKAENRDIQGMVNLSSDFWGDALGKNGLGFNRSDFFNFVLFMVSSPVCVVLVCEREDGMIVGGAAATLSPWFMDNGQKVITEQWVWVDPSERGKGLFSKLEDGIKYAGKEMGASLMIMVSIGSSTEKLVDDFYARRGYHKLETHYIKEI